MKVFDVESEVSVASLSPFEKEARALETVSSQCEHVCRFYGVSSIEDQPCIVMKLYSRSLADELKAATGVAASYLLSSR